MSNKLQALIDKNKSNLILLNSPAVGIIINSISNRQYLDSETIIAKIKILNNTKTIISPRKITGKIKKINCQLGPIHYGQNLVILENKQLINNTNIINKKQKNEYYTSPMDGMFYRRSSPNTEAFINKNDIIKSGDVLGIIEVMKCFYKLQYEGIEFKKITQILVANSQPVCVGTKIFKLTSIIK
jgi:hypothetical protein